MKTCLACLLLATLVAAPAFAELELEVPVIELQAKPEDEVVNTTFVFHNKGAKAVKVLSIDSACSCLSAALDKAVYEPGEKGIGKAEFKVSSFVGRHEKALQVQTDDPAQPVWQIDFVLEVPAVVDIEPKTLQWWLGDPAEPKTCIVKMTGDEPLKILKLSATRENVEYSFKEIKPGREYEVTIKPKTTADVMLGALKIETDSKIPKYQRQLAFFSVYRKPATAAAAQP